MSVDLEPDAALGRRVLCRVAARKVDKADLGRRDEDDRLDLARLDARVRDKCVSDRVFGGGRGEGGEEERGLRAAGIGSARYSLRTTSTCTAAYDMTGWKVLATREKERTISWSAGGARPELPACLDKILRATGSFEPWSGWTTQSSEHAVYNTTAQRPQATHIGP